MCPPVNEQELNHWNCVMGNCKDCPSHSIPNEETTTVEEMDNIIWFHVYDKVTSCSVHGSLLIHSKKCPMCVPQDPPLVKKPKVSNRKRLALKEKTMGVFHEKFYLPALKKHASHRNCVSILSKNGCGNDRKNF